MNIENKEELNRKISPRELYENGLTKGGIQVIPPKAYKEKRQANLRSQRCIPYYIFAGRVYYDESDLMKWAEKQKVDMAS